MEITLLDETVDLYVAKANENDVSAAHLHNLRITVNGVDIVLVHRKPDKRTKLLLKPL